MNKKQKTAIVNYLKEFVSEARNQRIEEVLNQRTRHIAVVLENLFQSHNVSAVLRSADCFGVQDVHIVEKDFDTPVHSQIALGSDKWLTINRYNTSEKSLEHCILNLKSKGYKIVATLPHEKDGMLGDFDYTQKTALLFGTELHGLSPEAVDLADAYLKIPLYGFTESFNISVSAAIVMYQLTEKLRQSSVEWQLSEEEKIDLHLEWLKKSIKTPDLIIENYLKNQ